MNAHAQVVELLGQLRACVIARSSAKRVDELSDEIETITKAYMVPAARFELPGIHLTRIQARIAELLHKRMGKIVSREAILEAMYFDNPQGCSHLNDERKIVEVQICLMRRKLARLPYRIETIWGTGFRMVRCELSEAEFDSIRQTVNTARKEWSVQHG